MSSQFSYELDERQIRILMQNGELDFNELAWSRFENSLGTEVKPIKSGISSKLNISVSRSIIVPVLFVVLIGSLSVLLFSFVDFKKKEEVIKETPLVADPSKAKKTVKSTPVITPKKQSQEVTATVKTETPKETAITPNTQPVAETKPQTVANTAPATVQHTLPQNNTSAPVNTTKQPVTNQASITAQHKTITTGSVTPVIKKRKKKSVTYEELPSISPSSNLGTVENEPELDLK